MTLKTELPTNLLLHQLQFSNNPKIYYRQEYTTNKNITANDDKLHTTISMSEENFSLAERIKSVPIYFEGKMYQYILSQNWRPPTLPL